MGTHPIFESDFDCLTEHAPNSNKAALVADVTTRGPGQENATDY